MDDYTTSDGLVVTSVDVFASSWVKGTCSGTPGGSDIKPCIAASGMEPSAMAKCSFVNRPVFDDCRDYMDPHKFREWCMYDMCARSSTTNNKPLCIWISEYARACKEIGFIVDWMSDTLLAGYCSGKSINHNC